MSRRLLAVPAVTLALMAGCHKNGTRRDPIRPLPAADPSARRAPPTRPALPSPLARAADPKPADPPGSVPVVKLPSSEAAPPLLASPVVPTNATLPDTEADDRKPIRERIQDRREERKEKHKEAEKQPPTMPSPIAPKQPPADQGAGAPRPPQTGDTVRDVYQRAADRFARTPDYEARLVRREVVGGKEGAAEEILYQFRQQPFSIYMRNTGAAGRGREVLYVQGKFDGKMHVVIGEGDGSLFAPVGKKMAFEPTNPLVTSKSRHKITEAGMGSTLARVRRMIDAGQAKSLGQVTRKEYPYPLDGVELTLRPGDDVNLERGGRQQIFFDPNRESAGYAFPVLIVTTDAGGREVEYYCFDRFRAPAGLTDADFHPDRLGKKR